MYFVLVRFHNFFQSVEKKQMLSLIVILSLAAFIEAQQPVRSCSNCKFALRSSPALSADYLKCMLFPKPMDDDAAQAIWKFHLRTSNHYFCQTARSHRDMCGPDGGLYEPRIPPPHTPSEPFTASSNSDKSM